MIHQHAACLWETPVLGSASWSRDGYLDVRSKRHYVFFRILNRITRLVIGQAFASLGELEAWST
jgi:hypothetical protein